MTDNQENELKVYKKRAVIVNAVFFALFTASAVLSAFDATSLAGFVICCILSVLWTVLYTLFAHEKLYKINKSYAFVYIILSAVICGFTFLSFFICPKPALNTAINSGSSTLNDIIPFIIGIKFICDAFLAFKKRN